MDIPDASFRGAPAAGFFSCPGKDIDATGGWLFWKRKPGDSLRRSLIRRGQLFPVLVDSGGSGPVLVAGAARLACLSEEGRSVLCRDVGPLDAWERGLFYLESNAAFDIDDWRVVRALRYFRGLDPARLEEVWTVLGFEPRARRARQAVAWLKLPEEWDGLLAAGNIPLACVDALEKMDAAEIGALFPLFAAFSWSRGNAVNLLAGLRETGLRENRDIGGMLAAAREGLASDLSPKDAMARITAEIRALRYPELTALERNFAAAARRISAGTGWRLTQPDQFETEAVDMSVRLTCAADVERAARQLADMALADWSGIFMEAES